MNQRYGGSGSITGHSVHSTIKPDPTDYDLSALDWKTSSYSNGAGGMCVAVASIQDGPSPVGFLVRDSEDPDGPILSFSAAQWYAFLDGAEAGEFRGR
jgi:hypothetical protein